MSHSWSNAGVHVDCKSLNCESNNNCQCTIVYYEPKINSHVLLYTPSVAQFAVLTL